MVMSWYDTGERLAGTELAGKVVPTGGASPKEAELLQRYLQLRTVLPEAMPMSDAEVEALIVKVEAVAALVSVDESKLSGEWRQVWQRTAKEGTASQKALSPVSQKLFQNFIVDDDGEAIFRNLVQVTKKRVGVVFDVGYELPDSAREPPNRLPSTIKRAHLELKFGQRFGWKPLRIPLPLNGVGWLDVTFLSDEMRITRGNRGGVFVHMRDALLTREAAEATRPPA